MHTGFEFFDRFDPKPGDLWLFCGQPGHGKTTILRNLAAGVTEQAAKRNETRQAMYYELELAPSVAQERFKKLGRGILPTFTNHLSTDSFGATLDSRLVSTFKSCYALFVDSAHMLAGGRVGEHDIMALKSFAVRTECFVVATVQTKRVDTESEARLSWLLQKPTLYDLSSGVFFVNKTATDEFVVEAHRSYEGILPETQRPYVKFAWNRDTGRVEPAWPTPKR